MFQILIILSLLSLLSAGDGAELDSQAFSNAILNITTNLGASKMQQYYSSLVYTESPREVEDIADKLSGSLTQTFANAKDALVRLKNKVESSYNLRQFADDPLQCCNVSGLTPSYEFVAPVSEEFSCDRTSEISDSSAESLDGQLLSVYKNNAQSSSSLRWQYFGSEYGIINQFPSSKADDCESYDHRFRPWYIASATPKPKDVVLVIKNNIFATDEVRSKSFEAANIILRTLNPKDRLAVMMFNTKVTKLVSNGCYLNSLSLATPQNIAELQYFLETRPSPADGHDLLEALTTAFGYFVSQPVGNSTTQDKNRDRAVLLFTDGEILLSRSLEIEVDSVVANLTTSLQAKMFVFASGDIPHDVGIFYMSITTNPITKTSYFTELPLIGDLRLKMAQFYQSFSTSADASNSDFEPVFLAPYYDLFGLDQLVLTLATPCHRDDPSGPLLVGVTGVDLTVKDLLAAVEYFKEGEFSYAFVVDKEGITLFHPQLPEPSTNYTLVYLDISTLEPQNGFTEIRQSMISGLSGCKVINSTHVLPRGNKQSDGATTFVFPSSYCWRPIEGTPFSLCVVIPLNSARQGLNKLPSSSLHDYYHRIDVTASQLNLQLCQHAGSIATNASSVVKLSPESFAQPENYLQDNETEAKVLTLQNIVADKSDAMQLFRIGVVDSIAATQEVNKIWLSSLFTDQMVWKYIATSDGVLRIYPGIEVVPKDFNPILRPWYQRSVARLGSTAITSPYRDAFSGAPVVTVSKAILSESCSNLTNRTTSSIRSDPSCSVLAVMAVDFTTPSLWILLQKSISLCADDKYKCFLVDDNGYIITHPDLFNSSRRALNIHLTQLEPYVSQDMLSLGYMRRVYCNNFQYNNDFTQGPRRQYSYEITDMVLKSTSTLDGGSSNLCVFYQIAMVEGTNAIAIVIDQERSSFSRCKRLRCLCDPEKPCSRLPSDCKCPCSEDIPSNNYNPCLESFTGLTAPACPVRFGNKNKNDVFGETTLQVDDSIPYCFELNCTTTDLIECKSRRGCSFCPVCTELNDDCRSNALQCMPITSCPPRRFPTVRPSPSNVSSLQSSWKIIASVFIVFSSISLLISIVLLVGIILIKKHNRNTALSWSDDSSTKDGITAMSLNPVSRSSISESNSRSERTTSNATTAQLLELSSKGFSDHSAVTSHNATSIDEEASSYSPSQITNSPPTSGLGASNGIDTISELIDMRTHASGAGPLHSNSMASTMFTTGSYDPSQVGGIWF